MKTCLATRVDGEVPCGEEAIYRIAATCPSGHTGNSRACPECTARIRQEAALCDRCLKGGVRALLTIVQVATGRRP